MTLNRCMRKTEVTHETKIWYCTYTVYVGIYWIYIDYVSTVVLDLYRYANLPQHSLLLIRSPYIEDWNLQFDYSLILGN